MAVTTWTSVENQRYKFPLFTELICISQLILPIYAFSNLPKWLVQLSPVLCLLHTRPNCLCSNFGYGLKPKATLIEQVVVIHQQYPVKINWMKHFFGPEKLRAKTSFFIQVNHARLQKQACMQWCLHYIFYISLQKSGLTEFCPITKAVVLLALHMNFHQSVAYENKQKL